MSLKQFNSENAKATNGVGCNPTEFGEPTCWDFLPSDSPKMRKSKTVMQSLSPEVLCHTTVMHELTRHCFGDHSLCREHCD